MKTRNTVKMYKRKQQQEREHTNKKSKKDRKMHRLCERAFGMGVEYEIEEIEILE